MSFTIALSIEDALDALGEGARPIAGGSDLVVGARHGKEPLPTSLVAIDRIAELGEIEIGDDGCRVGAAVNHARLVSEATLVESYTALCDAAALIGSPATRNVGTIGGNIMNGSPAMDTGAPLVVLDATVELRSVGATRIVPITELWTGPGQTVAAADELCTSIGLPTRPPRSGSAYVRLEYRRAMEIAVVGAAASVTLDDGGRLGSVSVALAAVAPTIVAVPGLDATLGQRVDPDALDVVRSAASATASPISDVRAGQDYRRHAVGVMAARAVEAAARRAAGESIAVPVNRALGIGA